MTPKPDVTLWWIRQCFRLADNPALQAALETGCPVVPVYIHHPVPPHYPQLKRGAASNWWLHHSLAALTDSLQTKGLRLSLFQADPNVALQHLQAVYTIRHLITDQHFEPHQAPMLEDVAGWCRANGVSFQALNTNLLLDPTALANKQGRPYKVFTPFYRAFRPLITWPKPKPAPSQIIAPMHWPETLPLPALGLLPKINWAEGFNRYFEPGEAGALKRLDTFLNQAVAAYGHQRDIPGLDGTSQLSPHLHFGEISPQTLWAEVMNHCHLHPEEQGEPYLRQLVWREFAHHILAHFPQMPDTPMDQKFERMAWQHNPQALKAWQQGLTGYPIVDAGMRQLWHTGWLHNRVRMVVGSFLVKDLMIPWQAGADWFWQTLVDADVANNTMGWQWIAGCGPDAAPYFRIFNPTLQSRKFDPDGTYIRTWVPELAALPNRYLHEPASAPAAELERARLVLGKDYPLPMVNHAQARHQAMAAYTALK
ncbi:MAG: deoxyribodipyrimidine photo-lyase [Cyanobacteria bacterium HKST-UBA03]|nr:deoxyribodipyrimidine photo-lyase [Cyanobacteria bacterium HKST-UBA03]